MGGVGADRTRAGTRARIQSKCRSSASPPALQPLISTCACAHRVARRDPAKGPSHVTKTRRRATAAMCAAAMQDN